MAKIRKILVEHGEVRRIATLLSVTPQTVRNALKYTTEGDTPDKIRTEALKAGGQIMTRPIKESSKI